MDRRALQSVRQEELRCQRCVSVASPVHEARGATRAAPALGLSGPLRREDSRLSWIGSRVFGMALSRGHSALSRRPREGLHSRPSANSASRPGAMTRAFERCAAGRVRWVDGPTSWCIGADGCWRDAAQKAAAIGILRGALRAGQPCRRMAIGREGPLEEFTTPFLKRANPSEPL
jgi:hypothetical protein